MIRRDSRRRPLPGSWPRRPSWRCLAAHGLRPDRHHVHRRHARRATSATAADPCTGADRGRLLSTTPMVRLSPAQVTEALTSAHLPGAAPHGVDEYRVLYCTVSPEQTPTVASGLLALPDAVPGELPLVVYEHSTVSATPDVPSSHPTGDGLLAPPFFATDGSAVVAPDYVGLGASPGPHPFMVAASEASATLDLLPAAEAAAAGVGARLSHDVLLTGHSQGGAAAMATGQALQEADGPWRLRALAPMAGPYDLGGAELPAMTDPRLVDPAPGLGLPRRPARSRGTGCTTCTPTPVRCSGRRTRARSTRCSTAPTSSPGSPRRCPRRSSSSSPPPSRRSRTRVARWPRRWPPTTCAAGRPASRRGSTPAARTVTSSSPTPTDCRAQIVAHGGDATIEDMGDVDHVGTAVAALPQIRSWFRVGSAPVSSCAV